MKNMVILFLLIGLFSSGCVGEGLVPTNDYDNGDYDGDYDYDYDDDKYYADEGMDFAAAEPAEAMLATGSSGGSNTQRYTTKKGDMRLKVPEGTLDSAYENAVDLLESEGAQIGDIGYDEYADSKRYTITFKIRPSRFDSINEMLKELGEVKDMSVDIEDVTEDYVDLETRIKNKEIELERLYELYNRSETIEDLIAVEYQLTRVETELESLKGQKQRLDSKIELSTIRLILYEDKPSTQQLFLSIESLGNAFFGSVAAAIMVIAVLVGFLGPIGILIWVLWKIYKKVKGKPKPQKNVQANNKKQIKKI